MRVLVCDPQTEIIGQAMRSIIDNIQADEIRPFLEKHQMTHIDPNRWYRAQTFLDILNDLLSASDGTSNMVAVGMAVCTQMVMPPELTHASLPTILNMWNDLYHLQHRGSEIGSVKTEKISETHYRTIHDHLYPDDMVYGLAYGMARRFLPKGTAFQISYAQGVSRKDEGGKVTIVEVQWA